MRTNRFAVTYAALSAVVLSLTACGEPYNPPGIVQAPGEALSPAFGGEWVVDVSLDVSEALPVTYEVDAMLAVAGDSMDVSGVCPDGGEAFIARSTSPTSARWHGEIRCPIRRQSCPDSELVISAVTLSLAGDAVTGSFVGRIESRCDVVPPGVVGTLAAVRSTTRPTRH